MSNMKPLIVLSLIFAGTAYAQQSVWGQCGGTGWSGPTTCASGSHCVYSNPYYSQCLPGAGITSANPAPTVARSSSTMKTSTMMTSTTPPPSSTPTQPASGKVRFAGVNIAGFDFGCTIDGSCNLADIDPPLSSLGGANGAGQMQHFVTDDDMNIFRLPVAWQFLQSSPGATLSQSALGEYDQLVQACLATGAYCIIDIHNYARWNGAIIGQGGPTNAQFANLWSQLATKYASSSRVVFGIMNEPHDIPNMSTWAASVQAAVTAIRAAGATSQIILLPGNNYTSGAQFVSNGSGAALMGVKNLDGSTTNLIFDVHQYLDSDNSGTNANCVTNNVNSFTSLASWLRSNNRQALLSETGGGNTSSCETYLCQEIAYLNANSDVYLGYTGWAAGSFATSYVLSETPTQNGGSWTDQPLLKMCLAR